MSNQFYVTENLSELHEVVKSGLVFDAQLKVSNLLMILEILWNVLKNKDKKCKKCFSGKTLKRIKKHKKFLKFLFNKKKSLDERKAKFINADEKFKGMVARVLNEFLSNCVEKR